MPAARIAKQKVARRLRTQGKSLNEIARKLQIAKSSVSLWVRDIPLTRAVKRRLARRILAGSAEGRRKSLLKWAEYRVRYPKAPPNLNRLHIGEFFSTWTPEAAYVLGFFAADGCMYHSRNGGHSTGGLYIDLSSTDYQLIKTVKSIMRIKNKIERHDRSKEGNHQPKYQLRLVNRKAYIRLLQLGFRPAKSLTLQFPSVPAKILNHFVRGYFDGDGCIYRGQKRSRTRILTTFTSGGRQFLDVLRQQLTKIAGVQGGSLFKRGPHHFVLSYAASDSRQLYKFMYPTPTVPCLQRKRKVFEQAFKNLEKLVP